METSKLVAQLGSINWRLMKVATLPRTKYVFVWCAVAGEWTISRARADRFLIFVRCHLSMILHFRGGGVFVIDHILGYGAIYGREQAGYEAGKAGYRMEFRVRIVGAFVPGGWWKGCAVSVITQLNVHGYDARVIL